jgi:tRNA (cytidine/uridine-2'-O-)-methyltransferase
LPRGICVKQSDCRRPSPGPGLGPLDCSPVTDNPTQSDFYLRARPVERPFHIVLIEPEIPPNTGNVARLCAATCCPLHLVGRLGFRIDEHAVRRAGLDYWHLVEVIQHETLSAAEERIAALSPTRKPRTWLFSGHARVSYLDAEFKLGDAFVFGKESVGLPRELLEERADDVIGIPMPGHVRSHNLANAVAISLYEALRQNRALSPA